MRLKYLASLAVALAVPVAVIAAINQGGNLGYDINVDLENRGPAAHDLAIVLAGQETVTRTMNGHHSGHSLAGWFSPPSNTNVNGNTVIHWQNFWDDDNNQIDKNQTIHVGFSTSDSSHTIRDMYWTNLQGNRIPGSVVYDVKAEIIYRSDRPYWHLEHEMAYPATISLSNLRFAVLSNRLELEQLGRDNAELLAALQPLSGDVELAPGEALELPIPAATPAGSSLVIVYSVGGEGSGALLTNYVQAR